MAASVDSNGVVTVPSGRGQDPSNAAEESAVALSALDRFQPVMLIVSMGAGLGLAQLAPGFAGSLGPLVTAAVLALIYLVMLGVNLHEVAGAFSQRKFLATAVVVNFIVNPTLAWLLAEIFLDGHADLRVGLILFLVTPCIGWYLIFTEMAGGDASLGVSLLGVNLVLQVLLLPVYLWLFAGQAAGVNLGDITVSVLLFLVGPALAAGATRGALERSRWQLADVQDFVGAAHLKTAALVVVIVAMFASQADALLDNPDVLLTLLPPMLVFFILAFGIALAAGKFLGLPHQQTALLVFTSTSRNSEASLAIAATAFASPLVALTVVIGPVIELPLLVLMVRVLLSLRTSPSQATPSSAGPSLASTERNGTHE